MRGFKRPGGRRWSTGWLWAFALLVLPTCGLDTSGGSCAGNCNPGNESPQTPETPLFDPGPSPTSVVMCDIPKVVECEDESDPAGGSFANAALALERGTHYSPVLDFWDAAKSACGGFPRKFEFRGPFPQGLPVCLDCEQQIPAVYPDFTAACVAKCKDLFTAEGGPPPDGDIDGFCTAYARVSTNFDTCFPGICSNGGTPGPIDSDPRRDPEDLEWTDGEHVTPVGSTLVFDGPSTVDFSGGAASVQLITKGHAWVEFAAGETGASHVLGVRESCLDIINECPDGDETLGDIPLALSLNVNGSVYVLEDGEVLAGPFEPPYYAGERFRIRVWDQHDGKAEIVLQRLVNCEPNGGCEQVTLHTHPTKFSYPLRVDATFRELNPSLLTASLVNVKIMRIK